MNREACNVLASLALHVVCPACRDSVVVEWECSNQLPKVEIRQKPGCV